MTISERIETGRRERRVLARVFRAAWRLEQAERERAWALVSARAEGISIRTLAAAIGLSLSRVHQIVADADLDALDAELGELRAAGWPAPEDPDSGEDTELGGRDSIADRLTDEVSWLRQCADWLARLGTDSYPPALGRQLRSRAGWNQYSSPGAWPGQARRPGSRDLCPAAGEARLGYDRARVQPPRRARPRRLGQPKRLRKRGSAVSATEVLALALATVVGSAAQSAAGFGLPMGARKVRVSLQRRGSHRGRP